MRKKPYLIISQETGTEYRRKSLKNNYKNIKQGSVYRVYEVRRNIGCIYNGKLTLFNKEK